MFKFERIAESNGELTSTGMFQESEAVEDPFDAKIFELSGKDDQKLSLVDISNTFEAMAASNEPEKMIECTMLTKRRFQIKQKDIDFKDQICTMILLNDMTAFQKLEEERLNNASLTRTNSYISHEIMNPLRTVELFCGILLKTANSDEAKLLNAIMSGVKFIEFNVNNILNFSRVQSD